MKSAGAGSGGRIPAAHRLEPARRLRGQRMLRLLYNALWYPALPVALALSGGALDAAARRARLGRAWAGDNTAPPEEPRIWAHAASVGEVGALGAVASALVRERPGATLVVTTMTAAGREAARRALPGARAHLLAPLDCRAALGHFLGALRPTLVLIAETELWPNYFIESHRAGACLAIVNGRISARALSRYRCVRPLLREALECADRVLAQTPEDAERFLALGAIADRVVVTGNTKFDLASLVAAPLRPALDAFAVGRTVLVAGSTAPGEEQVVIDAWRELSARFDRLALVVAPRHLGRIAEVEALLGAARIEYAKASAQDADGAAAARVMLLDTMGDLRAMYGRGAAAFVGGSLAPGRGGQSLAEPAAAAVPVLFGPFHENQRAIAAALLEARAGAVVRNAAELVRSVSALLDDDAARRAAGRAAKAVVERMAGGVAATLAELRPLVGAPPQS
ncbi:MAG TPA: glycosyltransferase N-terminal domain-containing protein [Candidatus Binataceae bacterium]|nr:glycosyltransferase N-terminal domain-containing protein [Candidatus Binataceae bacterium]